MDEDESEKELEIVPTQPENMIFVEKLPEPVFRAQVPYDEDEEPDDEDPPVLVTSNYPI